MSLDPGHAGLRKCRATLRHRFGDLEGGVRDAAEAVILDRDDPAARVLLGELLLRIGRVPDAIACLTEAVALIPADVGYREVLAEALTTNGDTDTALSTLLDGIHTTPEATRLRNAAILLCIRRRDFVRAEGLAEQARIDGVADASTFGLKGHALSSLGRHDDAALSYGEALKLAPFDAHLRQLATRSSAPEDFVAELFDGTADRFESHIIELGYRIPGLIRRHVIDFAAVGDSEPLLDLGCGTGLIALALSDLALGPITGVDLSPRMLEHARAKGLYESLHVARLPGFLREDRTPWGLIVAGDLMCYFGPLDEMLGAVRDRMRPGGRFIFSVEELVPNHDGTVPGNGDWASGLQGRYAHAAHYLASAADRLGYRCLALERETLRYEAGAPVSGLLIVLERPRDNA